VKTKRGIRTPIFSEALEARRLLSLNVLTHHADAANDGADQQETVLTPANVNPTDFGKQFTNTVDGGDVIAQPLYMQNVNITTGSSPGVHSVTFVATEADGLYALDANTGATLWHDNFTNITDPTNLNPTTGVTTIQQADINGNPDVGSQLGILATPAIDPNTGILYLNANTKEIRSDGKHFVQRLWAISINNGAPVMSPALIGDTIAPSGLTTTGPYTYVAGPIIHGTGNNNPAGNPNPVYPDTDAWTSAPGGATGYVIAFNAIEQMERTAVSLINGSVYLGFASHGDDGPYYGWVLGYNASNLALNAAFNTAPTFEPSSVVGSSQPFWNLGGIWMSGSNISTDGTYLYVVTGNGAFNGDASNFDANGFPIDHDYGDTVLKLAVDSSTVTNQNGNGWGLKVADYFTPSNQLQLNNLDLDLGSGGATLLPDNILDSAGNPMLMVGGKESRIYLIDRNNMGKFNYNYPGGSTTADPKPYDRVVNEYANDGLNNGGEQIYSSATYYNGNVYIGVKGTPALQINLAAMATGGTVTPVATTLNFGYPGETFEVSSNGNTSGVAWALNPGGSDLLAYNAASFVNSIYDSNTNAGDALGGSIHFHVPTVANGMVYSDSRGGGLGGYGLKASYLASSNAFFSAPTNLTDTLLMAGDVHLNWTSNSTLATEFRVDRSEDGTNWTTVAYTANSVTSYDDMTIVPSTRYQYRVVGVSGPNVTPFSNVVVFAPPLNLSGQNFYVELDPNGTNVDIWTNRSATGGVSQSLLLSQVSGVIVTGTASNDSVTIDFSNGDPLPAGGLTFNGAAGANTLTVIGGNGNDTVTVNTATITVAGAFGSVPIGYSNTGSIVFSGGTGTNVLTQAQIPGGGAGVLFSNVTASDTINVNAGNMTIQMPTTGATVPVAQLGSLSIGNGGKLTLAPAAGSAGHALLSLGNLTLAGSTANWQSQLNLTGNDLVLHNGVLATLATQISQGMTGNWSGEGIISSTASVDPGHLTSLGYLLNNDGSGHLIYGSGSALGAFDGVNPVVTDLLVRDTYYGDANLDGRVDGSDYTKIDNGFTTHLTGWINGDFNYDGKVDGSDYTLIDNAFNTQSSNAPSHLAITTASITVAAGAVSANVNVQLRDALGNTVKAGAGGITVTLNTTSSGGEFLNGSATITSIFIPAGSSAASFLYSDTQAGNPTITVSAPGLGSVTQAETITSSPTATQVAISTGPFSLGVGSTSGLIIATLENSAGNSVTAGTGGVNVLLSTTSATGSFKSIGGTKVAAITIPAGSSVANFTYSDTTVGTPTVGVSAAGLASATEQETMTATLASIAFATPSYTLIVGASPAAVTIQLQDQVGNPIVAGSGGVVVALTTSSPGGTFYNSSNVAITSITVPAGASNVTVAYRDSHLGTPTLSASAAGLATINQQQTVNPLPTGTVAYYNFGSSAGLLTDTSGTGNTLKVGAGTVAFTSTSLPAGFTGAANFSNSGYLTTASGNFPTSVPTGNSTYTIAAWIDINNSNKNGIVGWGNWGTTDNVNAFRTTQGDSAPDGAGLDNYWWANDYIQPTVNLVNNWVYAAVTYDGSVRSIYVNGVLLGTFSGGADNAAATNFRIGSTNNGEFFGGNISDLLIANTALTVSQIDALYNGT
jgi:hypothetical protein